MLRLKLVMFWCPATVACLREPLRQRDSAMTGDKRAEKNSRRPHSGALGQGLFTFIGVQQPSRLQRFPAENKENPLFGPASANTFHLHQTLTPVRGFPALFVPISKLSAAVAAAGGWMMVMDVPGVLRQGCHPCSQARGTAHYTETGFSRKCAEHRPHQLMPQTRPFILDIVRKQFKVGLKRLKK